MKTKLLLKSLLLAISVILFSFKDIKAQAVESEPNNTQGSADRVKLNGSGSGFIGGNNDADWWKVTTTADGKISVSLTNFTDPNLMYVGLYDTAYDLYAFVSAPVGHGTGGISYDGLAAGTYYIKIQSSFKEDTGSYTFSNTLTVANKPNDIEPNNNRTTALTLGVNNSTTGHVGYYYNSHRDSSDWYKIITPKDGMLNLTMDNTGNNAGLAYLDLFDNDGTTSLGHASIGNGIGGINKDGLAAGTYYVRISGDYETTNAYGPYQLTDSLKTYSYSAEKEPNNRAYQALLLPTDTTVTGHVNFYYKNISDTADWYKLNYTGTGKITFGVKIEPSLLNGTIDAIYVDAYKDTLQAPVYSQACFSATNTFKFNKGKYYIKVYPYYFSTGPTSYSIKTTVPAVTGLDDATSEISSLQNEKFTWNVSGNAAANNCAVQLKLNTEAHVTVSVVSLSGNTVQNIQKGKLQAGSYSIPLNFTNTIAGMYIVNLIVDNQNASKNVLK